MFNKKKVLLLVSLATAIVCSATVQVGAFAANNSVQLNETPVIESTELKGSNFGNVSADFDLPDGWVYVYDANKTTYTSADIQVKQRGDLTLTASNKIETLKQSTSDNQLKTHLEQINLLYIICLLLLQLNLVDVGSPCIVASHRYYIVSGL